jgi:hypothetical protein
VTFSVVWITKLVIVYEWSKHWSTWIMEMLQSEIYACLISVHSNTATLHSLIIFLRVLYLKKQNEKQKHNTLSDTIPKLIYKICACK